MQAGWSGWRKVAGVICDRRVAARVNGESIKDGSETSYVVWFGGGGADKKTGSGAGGGRVKDAAILVGSDEDGQD